MTGIGGHICDLTHARLRLNPRKGQGTTRMQEKGIKIQRWQITVASVPRGLQAEISVRKEAVNDAAGVETRSKDTKPKGFST
jgi:hypothetical protein